MNVAQTSKTKGFTIIEVVLVLAIAGLIFLMVFIALPALQRSQRDTQRRNDLSRVESQLQTYQTNNRQALPPDSGPGGFTNTGAEGFIAKYLTAGGDTFSDPNGTAYSFAAGPIPDGATYDSTKASVYYTRGAICNGETAQTGQGSGKIAFQLKLEGGGVACVSN